MSSLYDVRRAGSLTQRVLVESNRGSPISSFLQHQSSTQGISSLQPLREDQQRGSYDGNKGRRSPSFKKERAETDWSSDEDYDDDDGGDGSDAELLDSSYVNVSVTVPSRSYERSPRRPSANNNDPVESFQGGHSASVSRYGNPLQRGSRLMPSQVSSGVPSGSHGLLQGAEQTPLLPRHSVKAELNDDDGGGSYGGTQSEAGSAGFLIQRYDDEPLLGKKKGCDVKSILNEVVFGCINSIILAPVMVAFAQIIFSHSYFAPSMPYLVKLAWFSSIVHQCVFTMLSSLPFAIGQVQDAGLIFLSAMSTSIVKQLVNKPGITHNEIMASVLCWLAMSTTLLGMFVWLTGKLRLASLVQYLPWPAVGGYLAFIGLFCLKAGLSLMTGVHPDDVTEWRFFFSREKVILMLPGVACGIAMFFIISRFRHFAVLPACLVVMPIAFYVVLAILGVSTDEARTTYGIGWLGEKSERTEFYLVWEHFDFSKVHWSVVPSQMPTWIGMYFVVAFSSCLDVAAIQMELGTPLDFNRELRTVGISNLISGVTGGFTGSYIFSQTIFTMRNGVRTKINGLVIILIMLTLFMIPVSPLDYIPKFFFGAILVFIAVDLMLEWLWHARHLAQPIEYLCIWLTFLAILGINNLEYGFLIGIGLCLLVFVFQYSHSQATRRIRHGSNVTRSFAQRSVLEELQSTIVPLELSGYVFFGSAVRILKELERSIIIPAPIAGSVKRVYKGQEQRDRTSSVSSSKQLQELDAATAQGTRFLVLDLSRVDGIDATAVRSCFLSSKQTLRQYGIYFVLAGMRPKVQALMTCHGVLDSADETCRAFETLDEALEWCEDIIIEETGVNDEFDIEDGMKEILMAYLSLTTAPESHTRKTPNNNNKKKRFSEFNDLDKYFKSITLRKGQELYNVGDSSDALFFVSRGRVNLYQEEHEEEEHRRKRVRCYAAGGIFGENGFFLQRPRKVCAVAADDSTAVFSLNYQDFARMQQEHASLAVALQTSVVKSSCLAADVILNHRTAKR